MPNQEVRALVVDDSPLFSEVIKTILETDPNFRVVGVASHGREAVELTKRLTPNVITMDVHMPVMGGLEAIEQIMAEQPTPILVVTGDPRATDGDELHFEALRRGALDVFPKPANWPGNDAEQQAFRDQVKLLSGVTVVRHLAGHRHRWQSGGATSEPRRPSSIPPPGHTPPPLTPVPQTAMPLRREIPTTLQRTPLPGPVETPPPGAVAPRNVRMVAVVGSTGGPAALARILETLPGDFPAPILVVQHIAAGFAPSFASWLNDVSDLTVRLAEQGDRVADAEVLVAPDGAHMKVSARGTIVLDTSPPVDGHRPSGTPLFSSVAGAYGRRGLGLLLSGMGGDGVPGLEEIRVAGGATFAQDEASCVVFGMPKVALETGAATRAVPLADIPDLLCRAVNNRVRCKKDRSS